MIPDDAKRICDCHKISKHFLECVEFTKNRIENGSSLETHLCLQIILNQYIFFWILNLFWTILFLPTILNSFLFIY